MKKSLIILIIAAALLAGSAMGFAFAAGGAGSESDPVVTKSYVDSLVAELKANQSFGSGDSFKVVNFTEGTTVVCGEGTEFILRKKNSIKVNDETTNGLSDLTAGSTLHNGKNIPRDHLFVVPRDDGRGFICTTDTIVMIKGSYEEILPEIQ